MRRHLSLLLAAFLVAAVAYAPTAIHPAAVHANAACWFSDTIGVPYDDWYAQTFVRVNDSYSGGNPTHDVGIDLKAYRYSDGNGHCFRGYYGSDWTQDGSGMSSADNLRWWVCGTGPANAYSGASWGSRSQATTPTGSAPVVATVTLPNGVQQTIGFYDYGTGPCLPQADTTGSFAHSPTWNPNLDSPSPAGLWYCHDSNTPYPDFWCAP